MATINFLYRSKNKEANLSLRLLYRDALEVDHAISGTTKIEVTKLYWQKQHNLKRVSDIDLINKQTEVNKALNNLRNHIINAFNSLSDTEATNINNKWLKGVIHLFYNPDKKITKTIPTDLIGYIDYYINIRGNELSQNSIKKINVVKHKLERFQDYRKKIILIKDVDLKFKKELEDYLIAELYASNTITRDIRYVKTFCNHAKYNGIETSYQLEKVKSKYKKVDSIYLADDEIQNIENKKGLSNSLENVKDWLLISCHTGQRISDFLRFNKNMIRYEKNKKGIAKPLIEFTQKKTGKIMTIPLSPKVMHILEKRNGEFPNSISDQKYNDYIKEVCKKAKINDVVKGSKLVETFKGSKKYRKESDTYKKWELVSSHIGRRSFATNNYGKIPTSFLKYVTGHSTEAMFLSYIGKSNKDIAMELTQYL